MLTKKISPLKLELVSSYEMRITEPHMLEVGSQEIAASPFEASYVAMPSICRLTWSTSRYGSTVCRRLSLSF